MLIWQFVPQCYQTFNHTLSSAAFQDLVAQWATIISHWICTVWYLPRVCQSKKKSLLGIEYYTALLILRFGGSQLVIWT